MEVVVVGNFVADLIAKPITRMPEPGKLELVEQLEMHSGGCAVNTGSALGRLGVQVGVVGKIGQDVFGDFLLSQLAANHVDTGYVRRTSQVMTSMTWVMVNPAGERSFFHHIGANNLFRLEDVDPRAFQGAKIMHVAGELAMPAFDGEPTAQALKLAKEAGCFTSMDTSYDGLGRWLGALEPCFPYTDLFMPSLEEARHITGKDTPEQIADFLLQYPLQMVCLKLGEQGCYIRTRRSEVRVPAFQTPVLDTTGAGDSFAGGFLVGILRGWSLEVTGRFANAVGAQSVSAVGASTGIGGYQHTLEFMDRTPTRG
jgi:sugar/nucleoside kinase (ribokinase family)